MPFYDPFRQLIEDSTPVGPIDLPAGKTVSAPPTVSAGDQQHLDTWNPHSMVLDDFEYDMIDWTGGENAPTPNLLSSSPLNLSRSSSPTIPDHFDSPEYSYLFDVSDVVETPNTSASIHSSKEANNKHGSLCHTCNLPLIPSPPRSISSTNSVAVYSYTPSPSSSPSLSPTTPPEPEAKPYFQFQPRTQFRDSNHQPQLRQQYQQHQKSRHSLPSSSNSNFYPDSLLLRHTRPDLYIPSSYYCPDISLPCAHLMTERAIACHGFGTPCGSCDDCLMEWCEEQRFHHRLRQLQQRRSGANCSGNGNGNGNHRRRRRRGSLLRNELGEIQKLQQRDE